MEPDRPLRSPDPREVRRAVARDGVAVMSGRDEIDSQGAIDVAHEVFGEAIRRIPPPAEVRAGGVRDKTADAIDETMPLPPHTDGFAYGDRYPDHFLLACERSSPYGGESFAVDGHAVLDRIASRPDGAALLERMSSVAIEQTEPGMRSSLDPLVGRAPGGRPMLRRFPFQVPAADSADPAEDARMIAVWHEAVSAAGEEAPRFRLEPGDVVVFDNYRMMHGREPYTDPDRLMWRVWIWTDEALGIPDGRLHSDSRYAGAT